MKVEKTASGKYRIRVIIGYDDNGKPIRRSFTNADKKKLLAIAHSYANEHRTGKRKNLGKAIDDFLTAKTPVLSPSTIRAYTSLAKTLKSEHAAFCALPVDAVTIKDMQMFINSLLDKGNTPKTVRNFHGFLSAVFKYAGERMPEATLPQKTRPVIHIPDEQTARRIMEAVKGTRLEVPAMLAFFALRRSEICALSINDLYGDVIHVHSALVYGKDCKPHLKATKTYTSDRFVKIPSYLADLIRLQGYVTDYTPHGLSHAFNRMLEKENLPHFRLHDLRHWFVSYCHNILKLSDAQIQSITGHKTSAVMRVHYLHVMDAESAANTAVDGVSKLSISLSKNGMEPLTLDPNEKEEPFKIKDSSISLMPAMGLEPIRRCRQHR